MFKIVAIFCGLIYSNCFSETPIRIKINRGQVEAEPIIVKKITCGEDPGLGKLISGVICKDLYNSGLFDVKDESSSSNVNYLVSGSLTKDGNEVSAEITLSNGFNEEIFKKKIQGKALNWRYLAHKISDEIYCKITGEEPVFYSKLIYAEQMPSQSLKNGKYRARKMLVQIDQDGDNRKPISDGKNLVLTPRYSPDGNKIAFLTYKGKRAQVAVMDLGSKAVRNVDFVGNMTYAPRFSTDNKSLVMSITDSNGKSAIYVKNGGSMKRLTSHRSIDTSPCFSPDDNQIVFTSDRAGKEHIFIMNNDGSGVRRISYGDGKYSTPHWSPRGDFIAFTKQVFKEFFIGVMKPNGEGERLIAQGHLVESPCWSPNGRYIAFTKEDASRKSGLYVVDVTGRFMRHIPTSGNASDATWSPVIGKVSKDSK